MVNNPYVLQALKILGPEEILKLSEVLQVKQIPLKMAAGEELIVWDDGPSEQVVTEAPRAPGKILEFPKKNIKDMPVMAPEASDVDDVENYPGHISNELVLWQREITKEAHGQNQKLDAFKGYKRATEMYVVKTPSVEGKDKIRFASTNGILVNKKQA